MTVTIAAKKMTKISKEKEHLLRLGAELEKKIELLKQAKRSAQAKKQQGGGPTKSAPEVGSREKESN